VNEDSSTPLATIRFFNVGQGDSILIELRNGQIILVDSNISRTGWSVEPPALDALRERFRAGSGANLDLLCLTHPDRDHYRGLDRIIDWVRENNGVIRRYITSVLPDTKEIEAKVVALRQALQNESLKIYRRNRNRGYQVYASHAEYMEVLSRLAFAIRSADENGLFQTANGFKEIPGFDAAQVFILGPTTGTVKEHETTMIDGLIESWTSHADTIPRNSSNSVSCILWLVFPSVSVELMLTGDATAESWAAAIRSYQLNERSTSGRELNSDIVKAPHHGAESSSSREIWEQVLKPNGIVLFSAGGHRGYGHPDPKTLADIRDAHPGAQFFCTNLCPHHLEVVETAREATVTARAFYDSEAVAGIKPQKPSRSRARAYHGTCTFAVLPNGKIKATTEFTATPPFVCDHHA